VTRRSFLSRVVDESHDRRRVGSSSAAKYALPLSGSHSPDATRRLPYAAGGSPRPSRRWAGRDAHPRRPAGSSSATPRDARRAARPDAGSPASGLTRDTSAQHADAARRGTSSVLPQKLPPHSHQTMINKLHESGGGSGTHGDTSFAVLTDQPQQVHHSSDNDAPAPAASRWTQGVLAWVPADASSSTARWCSIFLGGLRRCLCGSVSRCRDKGCLLMYWCYDASSQPVRREHSPSMSLVLPSQRRRRVCRSAWQFKRCRC
jgi:hypothetical protein